MFRHAVIAFALTTTFVITPVFAAEKVPSPQYQSWAGHKPGTAVTMRQTMKMAAMTIDAEMHQELKAVTPDKVTVQTWTTSNVSGMKRESPRQTIDLPATVDKGAEEIPPGYDGKVEPLPDETVTVGGKAYDCKVLRFTGSQQGMKSDGKVWVSDAVPGRTVKIEMKVTGDTEMTMTGELAAVEKK